MSIRLTLPCRRRLFAGLIASFGAWAGHCSWGHSPLSDIVTKVGLCLPSHDQRFNPELIASHPSHNPRCHRDLFARRQSHSERAHTAELERQGAGKSPTGKWLSTRAIHRIITEGLLLAGVKKPGIVVHSLRPRPNRCTWNLKPPC